MKALKFIRSLSPFDYILILGTPVWIILSLIMLGETLIPIKIKVK